MVASSHRMSLPLCQILSVFCRAMDAPRQTTFFFGSRMRIKKGQFDYNLADRHRCLDEKEDDKKVTSRFTELAFFYISFGGNHRRNAPRRGSIGASYLHCGLTALRRIR